MLEGQQMQGVGKNRDTKDQFYTKRSVAESCVKEIISCLSWSSQNTLWIEPSAGAGAFLTNKYKTIALDLEPKAPGIVSADFLTWHIPPDIKNKYGKVIFFGNPPFGRQGSIAKKFLKHSCEQGASALAFILPRSFMKPSMYQCIPLNYHLIKEVELPKDSFEVNNEAYDVPCIFQIWEKRDSDRISVIKEQPDGFTYVKSGETYHLAFRRVGGDAGKTFKREDIVNPSIQSHHFLRFDDGIDVANIQKRINAHTFPSNTTGPRSLSKSEINSVINKFIHEFLDAEFVSLRECS